MTTISLEASETALICGRVLILLTSETMVSMVHSQKQSSIFQLFEFYTLQTTISTEHCHRTLATHQIFVIFFWAETNWQARSLIFRLVNSRNSPSCCWKITSLRVPWLSPCATFERADRAYWKICGLIAPTMHFPCWNVIRLIVVLCVFLRRLRGLKAARSRTKWTLEHLVVSKSSFAEYDSTLESIFRSFVHQSIFKY